MFEKSKGPKSTERPERQGRRKPGIRPPVGRFRLRGGALPGSPDHPRQRAFLRPVRLWYGQLPYLPCSPTFFRGCRPLKVSATQRRFGKSKAPVQPRRLSLRGRGGLRSALPARPAWQIARLGTRNFKMLVGSKFRLRQGFACGKTLVRRIRAAPSMGWGPKERKKHAAQTGGMFGIWEKISAC